MHLSYVVAAYGSGENAEVSEEDRLISVANRIERLACFALCAAALMWAAEPLAFSVRAHRQIDTAYFDGQEVTFTPPAPQRRERIMSVGPWLLGPRAPNRKPSDKRPNLYIVSPGNQHHLADWDDFDHNAVLSALPSGDEPVEYDVYWALVLDPALREEIRSERDLLLATQSQISPTEQFAFEEVPAARFLRRVLKVHSLADLEQYRRKDGAFPQIVIIPAEFAVRALVQAPKETPEAPPGSPPQ